MKSYKKMILRALVASYEGSTLFLEQNRRNVDICFRFTKKKIPEYFDETSVVYDEIHREMEDLERLGFLHICWKNEKVGHIISKVSLCPEKLDEIHHFLGSRGLDLKRKELTECMEVLQENATHLPSRQEILLPFFAWIAERLEAGLSIKAYVDFDDLDGFQDLIRGVCAVADSKEEYFIRELSMLLYGDSKRLEELRPKIESVIQGFWTNREQLADVEDVFASFGILKNPSVLMIKGDTELCIGGVSLSLKALQYGLGVSSKDLEQISFGQGCNVKKILTVENLTAFHRMQEPGTLIIYLGGFHNTARRNLLCKAAKAFPEALLFHWGDIDVGGFKIFFDLRKKTDLPFVPFRMEVDTLEKYRKYAKPLTANDRKELERMRGSIGLRNLPERVEKQILAVLEWMLEKDCKLEQEIVALK